MKRYWVVFVAAAVFLTTVHVGANAAIEFQDHTKHSTDPVAAIDDRAAPAGDADPYAAGHRDVYPFFGTVSEAFAGRGETLYFGGAGFEYFPWDNISAVFEAVGYHVSQSHDADGYGFNLLGRWHFWRPCPALAVFIEGGAGMCEGTDNIPSPEGTYFNFTLHVGIGAKLRLGDNVSIIGGARFFHLSNARLEGGSRNPGIDALGGYGGVVIDF